MDHKYNKFQRTLTFLLSVFLGAIQTHSVTAQVISDTNAPRQERATVLQTANGVPLVNIQTPNAKGVSRNAYSKFDVNSAGVILNNSRNSTQTQLGGNIAGNPWLATGSARVIVNEVNSSNPSLLNGAVEVAGQRAEVIISNPSGISCNGCGFINAQQNTLTTGTPLYSGGSLNGFRVEQGTININGTGLDASSSDYTSIIARAVNINAKVWAKDLRVSAGANQVNAVNTQVTEQTATGTPPSFALDVSFLGGMYANKITLVGTEDGVGMRNAGEIGAGAGGVSITADGKLINTNLLQSSGNINVSTTGALENSGAIDATSNTTLNTNSLNNSGQIYAKSGDLNVSTNANITNSGIIKSQNILNLTSQGQITNSGSVYSESNTNLTAANHLENTGNITANNNTTITLTDVGGTLNNQANALIGSGFTEDSNNPSQLAIKANPSGQEQLTIKLNTTNSSLTNKGSLQSAANINIETHTLNNTGRIAANSLLKANTSTVSNTAVITGASVDISASTQILNVSPNALIGASSTTGSLKLLAPVIENRDDTTTTDTDPTTTILGLGEIVLAGVRDANGNYTKATRILNQSGLIQSLGNMQIHTNTLTNTRRQVNTSNAFTQVGGTESGTLVNGNPRSDSPAPDPDPNAIGGVPVGPPEGGEFNSDYLFTAYTKQTFQNDLLSTSPKSQILSDIDITLNADQVNNYWSEIKAGKNTNLINTTLDQDSWRGATPLQERITYRGTYEYRTFRGLRWNIAWGPTTETNQRSGTSYDSVFAADTLTGSNTTLNNTGAQGNITLQNASTPANQTYSFTSLNSNLYSVNANSNAFLIQTNSGFISTNGLIGTDLVFNRLSLDPNRTQFRLGDAFYEQQLVRKQIADLTERPILAGFDSNAEQFKTLLENGIAFAEQFNLRPGIQLTGEMLAQLTHNLIWLEEETVTLPNGKTTKVLVPKVYLRNQGIKVASNGSLIQAREVSLTNTLVHNSGTIRADENLSLSGNLIDSRGGELESGGVMTLASATDIDLTSAVLKAGSLNAIAGQDIKLNTDVTESIMNRGGSRSTRRIAERQGSITVEGDATLNTGRNLEQNAGELNVGGDLVANIGQNWLLGTVENQDISQLDLAGGVARHDIRSQVTSSVNVGGNTLANIGNNLVAEGAEFNLRQGGRIETGGDILLNVATNTQEAKNTYSGSGASGYSEYEFDSVTGTRINSGDTLALVSGQDINLIGTNIQTEQGNLLLNAESNIILQAARERRYSKREGQSKGFMSSSSYLEETNQVNHIVTELTAGDVNGTNSNTNQDDLSLNAANNIALLAPELKATGDVTLEAENGQVTIGTVTDTDYEHYEYNKTGFIKWAFGNEGHLDETIRHTEITAGGDIRIQAKDGVIVELKRNGNLNQSIEALSQLPELAWMAELRERDDIDWQTIEEQHEYWSQHESGIGGPGLTLITLAVGFASGGFGAGILGLEGVAASSLTFAQAAQIAVLDTLIHQATTSLIINGGDIGAVFKDLVSSENLLGLATAGLSAGITNGLFEGLDLNIGSGANGAFTLGDKLTRNVLRAAVNSGVSSTLQGGDFADSFFQQAATSTVNTLAVDLTNQIGDLEFSSGGEIQEGDIVKVLSHAAVGCAAQSLTGGSCSAGAIGAATAELLAPHLSASEASDLQAELSVIVGSGLAALVTGEDVNDAISSALRVEQFNRQLHTQERITIEQAVAGFAEAENISPDEAEKRLTRELLRHVDKSWNEVFANEGDISDPLALQYLSEALVSVGGLYEPPADIPAFEEATNYSPEQIQQWLVDYKTTNQIAYEDRTLLGENLFDREQWAFYNRTVAQSVPYSEQYIETVKGGLSGTASGAVAPVNDILDLLRAADEDFIGTSEAIVGGITKLIVAPDQVAKEFLDNRQEAAVTALLDQLQGDYYTLASNEAHDDTKTLVELVTLASGGVASQGKKVVDVNNPNKIGDIVDDNFPDGPATTNINAVRLNNQKTAEAIADGHAFEKHVLGLNNRNGNEFAGLGIRTRRQFKEHIENTINNPTHSGILRNDRSYFYDANTNTIVIKNPNAPDGGTIFRIDTEKYSNPFDYINNVLN